VCDVDITL